MGKLLRLLMAAIVLTWAHTAAAHLTPNSEIRLSPADDGYAVQITIPATEYAYASGNDVDGSAASQAAARAYLRDRFSVTDPQGRALRVEIDGVGPAADEGALDLIADARIVVPQGSLRDTLTLHWSAVIDRVPDHFALVIMEAGGERRVLGTMRQVERSLAFDAAPSRTGGLWQAIVLGAEHIIGGFDHLLFLLALLISAPLIAKDGQWVGVSRPRRALWRLAKVTTGFTIGHSVTLLLAGLGNWALPVAPVEALIAFSVIVTAAHAIRPIFPGREAWVATGFGLIHGLAFATLAAGSEGMPAHNLTTLLGFNIGIELVQLAVLAGTLPILFIAMRNARFEMMRTLAGTATAICGAVWMIERLPGLSA